MAHLGRAHARATLQMANAAAAAQSDKKGWQRFVAEIEQSAR
jgi:hypothetical protein